MTGDEYLVLVENASYEDFTQQVHSAYTKLENISLGLVSVGYAWGKVDIDVNGLVISAENMMREEKKKYYKNLRKGHHEPIIKRILRRILNRRILLYVWYRRLMCRPEKLQVLKRLSDIIIRILELWIREDILIFWKRQGCHIISISIYLNRYVRSFISGRQKESRWCRFQ